MSIRKGYVISAITAAGTGASSMTVINPQVLKWFETRGIDPETVARTGIYSGKRHDTGAVEPDPYGNVIVFPTIRNGQTVAEKYRGAHKTFWQKPGGLRSFYNAEILSDPALTSGQCPLIITEGELDWLSALQCGFPHTVSVPDGAPPENYQGDDFDQKFSYIMLDWERLKLIKRITIAVDSDGPGKKLAEELVRRLGRIRCYWVEYPEGCKDLNDVLRNHGPAEVAKVLNSAKPYPVNGLYSLSEFPPEPPLDPRSTGWGRLDDLIRVFYPCFMVITGFAGAGKSTWANQLVSHLAIQHNWRAAIASYEMRLDPYVTDTLRSCYIQKPKHEWTREELTDANNWIEENFMFISPSHDDEQHDIDWLIERASAAVIRHGIRVLLVDPWNEIEHLRAKGEQVTDYVGRAIQALKRFGRDFDCLVIVVAHPTKEGAKKKAEDLSLYDVSDSAHFANKADLGVVMIRQEGLSRVLIRKVRFQPDTGRPGDLDLSYDPALRLFAQ